MDQSFYIKTQKKMNVFEPKQMINPQYLVDLLEDVEKKLQMKKQLIKKIKSILQFQYLFTFLFD